MKRKKLFVRYKGKHMKNNRWDKLTLLFFPYMYAKHMAI